MKIKHLLTKKCHVGCKYCLEKNINNRQVDSPLMIGDMYAKLNRAGFKVIDLTGGEPTMHRNFPDIALAASNIFDEVHLYTADHTKYNLPLVEEVFRTINFGWHNNVLIDDLPEVSIGIPVYAQTMHYWYGEWIPYQLKRKGFSGLSINTDKHIKIEDYAPPIPDIENFSIRVNDNSCYAEGTLLMPDLSIVKDVGQYLDINLD